MARRVFGRFADGVRQQSSEDAGWVLVRVTVVTMVTVVLQPHIFAFNSCLQIFSKLQGLLSVVSVYPPGAFFRGKKTAVGR